MKKISKIMDELGFRPEGSDDVKKAFIKNLINEANTQEFERKKQKPDTKTEKSMKGQQPNHQYSLFDQKKTS